jgi:ribosomal protein S15
MKMIGRRRRLLRYLSGKSAERYQAVIKELGLRK